MKSALFTAVPVMLLLSACSQTLTPQHSVAPASIISYDAVVKLDKLSPGQSAILWATPWGNNVSVTLIQRYRSAAGFDCVRLKLTDKTALACQTTDNLWLAEQAYVQ